MLLGRCEFGKDDYSFNIVNLPKDEEDDLMIENSYNDKINEEEKPTEIIKNIKLKKQLEVKKQSTLF